MRDDEEFGFIQVVVAAPVCCVHKNDHVPNRDPGMLLDGRLGLLSKFPLGDKAFRELRPREGRPPQKSTKRNQGVTKTSLRVTLW